MPPGISVLDVQVLETSNVLAYVNFLLCSFRDSLFV
jgi:hypothetical protein